MEENNKKWGRSIDSVVKRHVLLLHRILFSNRHNRKLTTSGVSNASGLLGYIHSQRVGAERD